MKSLSSEQSKYPIFADSYLGAITQGSLQTTFSGEIKSVLDTVIWNIVIRQGVLVARSTCFQSQGKYQELVQVCNNNWMLRTGKRYLLLLPSVHTFGGVLVF